MQTDMPFDIVDTCRENKVCLKSGKIGAIARKISPLVLLSDCVGSMDSREKKHILWSFWEKKPNYTNFSSDTQQIALQLSSAHGTENEFARHTPYPMPGNSPYQGPNIE